jgi:hypothetical protein
MIIAVLGDYASANYTKLRDRVIALFPHEDVRDFSLHQNPNWKKGAESRLSEIQAASLVIICDDWQDHIDVIHDINESQKIHKECFIDFNGQFLPFPEYSRRKS